MPEMTDIQTQSRARAHVSPFRRCAAALGRAVGCALIALVRCYQIVLSPLLPRVCRFQPSCSQYMIDAIRIKGPLIGVLKGLWRLLRCNPLCPGGYDPVQ